MRRWIVTAVLGAAMLAGLVGVVSVPQDVYYDMYGGAVSQGIFYD